MLSDEWLQRYRLLENFNKVERERDGNAYDRGDYNSSFALRAVELKSENKGADQLRGYREADLRLCFRKYAKKPVFSQQGLY